MYGEITMIFIEKHEQIILELLLMHHDIDHEIIITVQIYIFQVDLEHGVLIEKIYGDEKLIQMKLNVDHAMNDITYHQQLNLKIYEVYLKHYE